MYIYTCTYIWLYIHMYICTFVMNVYIYIHIWICIYIYILTVAVSLLQSLCCSPTVSVSLLQCNCCSLFAVLCTPTAGSRSTYAREKKNYARADSGRLEQIHVTRVAACCSSCIWVMSHVNGSCHMWVSHVTLYISHVTREWVMLHRCNTLQHTATHCNALQHTATHRNTLQHMGYVTRELGMSHCNTLQQAATHCNTLQHTASCYTWVGHVTKNPVIQQEQVLRAAAHVNMSHVVESCHMWMGHVRNTSLEIKCISLYDFLLVINDANGEWFNE